MKIAFTICSNNYLAQARVFKESFLQHNPGYTFFLGLVDRLNDQVDYSWLEKDRIVRVDEVGIADFESLWKGMDIVEFNTCVKPSFFKYFGKKYPEAETAFYFDPDICFYDSLADMESVLTGSDILITPHVLSPIPVDENIPGENLFLNYGLYNLGFLGLKISSENTARFLDWWEERCLKLGFNRPQHGLFVDQLWINLAPLYFEKVAVLRRLGYNMGPWNLHERRILAEEGQRIILNDNKPLVFYHFSSYSYKYPDDLSRFYNRIRFADNDRLKSLYDAYRGRLTENRIDFHETIPCYYVVEKEKLNSLSAREKLVRKVKDFILNLSPLFAVNLYRKKRNLS